MLITIAAKDVIPGDYIFNSSATQEPYKWVRVLTVSETDLHCELEGGIPFVAKGILIETVSFSSVLHRLAGITVRRLSSKAA